MNKQRDFFVSIASFCDPYLSFTIESAFSQASEPDSIALGVMDQTMEPLDSWLAELPHGDRVRYLRLHPLHARGVCWARHVVQTLYDAEAFFLQVDSHSWFQPGWDRILRAHFERLRAASTKPVLSIYPPGFEFTDGGKPIAGKDLGDSVGFFEPRPGQSLDPDDPVLTFKASSLRAPAGSGASTAATWHYARGTHLAGGFLCAPGAFVREVPYDPGFYFHGEEQGMALRAYTHGWDLFHPQFCRVPLRHLYKVPRAASPNLHWREDLEARRAVKWVQRQEHAKQRLKDLIAGRLEPPYGLGERRSLADFAERSGLDYVRGNIRARAAPLISLPPGTARPPQLGRQAF